jgi:hypothetical protein
VEQTVPPNGTPQKQILGEGWEAGGAIRCGIYIADMAETLKGARCEGQTDGSGTSGHIDHSCTLDISAL